MDIKELLEEIVETVQMDIDTDFENVGKDLYKKIVEAAKENLEYYHLDDLWSVDDVKNDFDCSSEEAQEVLGEALNGEWMTEQINVSITEIAEKKGLKEKE